MQRVLARTLNGSRPNFIRAATRYYSSSTDIPDFSHYTKSNSSINTSRAFNYFMVGTFGFVSAMGAKVTISDFLTNLSASADVLAMAKVELDLNTIPEGKNI